MPRDADLRRGIGLRVTRAAMDGERSHVPEANQPIVTKCGFHSPVLRWCRPYRRRTEYEMDALPFHDTTDFENADRGFLGALTPGVVQGKDGRVVWDNDAYGFLKGECPDTAHPSLWRQAQLVSKQGLYEVAEGLYQVRGLDLSNMTLVEGGTGVIVIDPLISAETAAAALALLSRAPRRAPGDRRHLHPLPRRPLRRGRRRAAAGIGRRPDLAPAGVHGDAVSRTSTPATP